MKQLKSWLCALAVAAACGSPLAADFPSKPIRLIVPFPAGGTADALPRILAELGHVAEGVLSAPTVLQRARSLGVAMPITEAVVGVLQGRVTPAEALAALMGREARPEH